MIMNDDYRKLCMERIRNINYLNELLNNKKVIISNEIFCSLFIIDDNTYNNKLAKSLDIEFIKINMNLEKITLDKENLINLLDLAVLKKVPNDLNRLLVEKCFNYYNSNVYEEKDKLNIDNINRVLDSIE